MKTAPLSPRRSALRARLTSLTRWLSVVVGCVVLETAQPMNAAESSSPPPAAPAAPAAPAGLDPERVLYPADSRPAGAEPRPSASGGVGPAWVFVLLVGLGAGAVWAWRRRQPGAALRRGASIQIEDTKALGNRQFLVVAGVDGRRFLIGVAPGSIRLLSTLDDEPETEEGDHARLS